MKLGWDSTITTPTSSTAPRRRALSEQRIMFCRRVCDFSAYLTTSAPYRGLPLLCLGPHGTLQESGGEAGSVKKGLYFAQTHVLCTVEHALTEPSMD